MKKTIIFFVIITTVTIMGLTPIQTGVYSLDASWLPDGRIVFTGPKYRGLYIYSNQSDIDTISNMWKAGYNFSVSPDGEKIAFSGKKDPDGAGLIQEYNLNTGEKTTICKSQNPGPPTFGTNGSLYFYDGSQTIIVDKSGNIDRFDYGAYLTVPAGDGFIWCDREGKANFFDIERNQSAQIEYSGNISNILFSPIKSPYSNRVIMEELGGPMILLNLDKMEIFILPSGEYPTFTSLPSGILYLEMADDGMEITRSLLKFISLEDDIIGEPRIIFESNLDRIITRADYSPDYGLLFVTKNGNVFKAETELKEEIR